MCLLFQIMEERNDMLKYLQKLEEKAAEILTDKQEIIAYDQRRNDDRVGMRALQKQKGDKTWITVGPLIIKMKSDAAEDLLKEGAAEIF